MPLVVVGGLLMVEAEEGNRRVTRDIPDKECDWANQFEAWKDVVGL